MHAMIVLLVFCLSIQSEIWCLAAQVTGRCIHKKRRNTVVENTRTKGRGPALIGVFPSFAGEDEVRDRICVLWLLA
jgi:hypothetical protein